MSDVATTIAPWLSVRNSAEAVEFYKKAFGATEIFRLEADDVIARLAVTARNSGSELNLPSTSTSARTSWAARRYESF